MGTASTCSCISDIERWRLHNMAGRAPSVYAIIDEWDLRIWRQEHLQTQCTAGTVDGGIQIRFSFD